MSAAWPLLPALGGLLAHAPALRWNLAPGLAAPISSPLFGRNKTWRGAIVMTGGTVAATLALHRLPGYRRRLPPEVAATDPARFGALLGTALWAGELPNSFLKRRLGIPPGQRRRSPVGVAFSIFDQADWVPAAWLLLRPVWRMGVREAVGSFVLVAAVHVPVNLAGYAVGARDAPL
jgi:hypothetical protein